MVFTTIASYVPGATQWGAFVAFVAIASLVWIASALYSLFFHPYADIPGPLWAKVTSLWLMKQALRGDLDKTQRKLHKRYGPLVRLAPNEVSVADPDALKVIYGVNSGFTKTDFYTPFAPHISPNEDLFTQQDEKVHAYRRRFVHNLYSLTSILESEQYIDSCTNTFMSALDEFATSGKSMDLGMWLQMYAFDVVGELFFGHQFGFMQNKHDHGSYIKSIDTLMPIMASVAVLPAYVRPIQVLALLFPPIRRAVLCQQRIIMAAKNAVQDRQMQMKKGQVQRSDLLDKLFKITMEKKDFGVVDVTTEAWAAIIAGSDTTAIAMRSILYFLMKNPQTYERVMTEIDAAMKEGKLSDPIKYAEAVRLPYFMACCKEGLRIHPSIGMSLPRHVSPGGTTIAGRFFPGGSRVGMNAHVLHLDSDIFGQDAEKWNPDRWLQPGAEVMDRYMMHFGWGPRTCVGKNISLAEIHKLLPNILLNYRIELVNPDTEWTTRNFWFHKQLGLDVRVTKRTCWSE